MDLSHAYLITDEALAPCLAQLRKLQVICLDRCKKIGDEGVLPLVHCRELTRIQITGTRITNLSLKLFQTLPFLFTLHVSGTLFSDQVSLILDLFIHYLN